MHLHRLLGPMTGRGCRPSFCRRRSVNQTGSRLAQEGRARPRLRIRDRPHKVRPSPPNTHPNQKQTRPTKPMHPPQPQFYQVQEGPFHAYQVHRPSHAQTQ